tara:strand:+ start:2976 stop:3281 length:306 start_codon:yes stop_codon:yes gene_type:complete
MKIVLPANASHDIDLIPRIYPTGAIVLALYNESTKVTTTPGNTYVIANGVLTVTFTKAFAEGDKYQIKITEGAVVIFRGKLLATAQTPQAYKLTDGLYFYE